MAERGIKVAHLRLRTIWPFPHEKVRELAEVAGSLLVPEMNLGQLSTEVERVAPESTKIVQVNKVGGGLMLTPKELSSAILRNMAS